MRLLYDLIEANFLEFLRTFLMLGEFLRVWFWKGWKNGTWYWGLKWSEGSPRCNHLGHIWIQYEMTKKPRDFYASGLEKVLQSLHREGYNYWTLFVIQWTKKSYALQGYFSTCSTPIVASSPLTFCDLRKAFELSDSTTCSVKVSCVM